MATGRRSQRSDLCDLQISTAVAKISSPVMVATIRWEYSMRVAASVEGKTLPWQKGQSGHPRPESVILTTPPRVIRANKARTEARVRARSAPPALSWRMDLVSAWSTIPRSRLYRLPRPRVKLYTWSLQGTVIAPSDCGKDRICAFLHGREV